MYLTRSDLTRFQALTGMCRGSGHSPGERTRISPEETPMAPTTRVTAVPGVPHDNPGDDAEPLCAGGGLPDGLPGAAPNVGNPNLSLACEFIGVCSGPSCIKSGEIINTGSDSFCTIVSGGPVLMELGCGLVLECSAFMGAPLVLAAAVDVCTPVTWVTAVPEVPHDTPRDKCTAASRAAACGCDIDVHIVDVKVFGNILFNLKVQLLSPIGDLLEGESLGKETKTEAGWLASSAAVEGKNLA